MQENSAYSFLKNAVRESEALKSIPRLFIASFS